MGGGEGDWGDVRGKEKWVWVREKEVGVGDIGFWWGEGFKLGGLEGKWGLEVLLDKVLVRGGVVKGDGG